jgi:hypothetical protein
MQKAGVGLSPTVMESKELWWTMSLEGSREVQRTNKHATTLQSRKQMKKKTPWCFYPVYTVCAIIACWGLAICERASNVTIGIWPRRADGAVALIQLNRGYTSRFSEYISKGTMLLVPESGSSRK